VRPLEELFLFFITQHHHLSHLFSTAVCTVTKYPWSSTQLIYSDWTLKWLDNCSDYDDGMQTVITYFYRAALNAGRSSRGKVSARPSVWLFVCPSNCRFPSKIALHLKMVCYKVSLCKNCQRQSCKAFIGLTIHAKMIGGTTPSIPEILGQSDRVGAKSPIFDLFSSVAPQP